MTLADELRAKAKRERDELVRFNLELSAVTVEDAIRAFAASPTEKTLSAVVGQWAAGRRLLMYSEERAGRGVA